MTILTIGVYGFTKENFIRALHDAAVSAIVDIRRRRGLRGAGYKFANATALELTLRNNEIRYIAEPRLAPTAEMRSIQAATDVAMGTAKQKRIDLAQSFIDAYKTEILANYRDADVDSLLSQSADRPCLLCVERLPEACHRGLAASWLAERTGSEIIHLIPEAFQRSIDPDGNSFGAHEFIGPETRGNSAPRSSAR